MINKLLKLTEQELEIYINLMTAKEKEEFSEKWYKCQHKLNNSFTYCSDCDGLHNHNNCAYKEPLNHLYQFYKLFQ